MTEVRCPAHQDTLCTIECTKDGACETVYLYVDSEYEGVNTIVDGEQNVIFECESETKAFCSPAVDYTLVICSDGEHCQKNCTADECIYQRMDATSALSLDLICDGVSSCRYSTILCPTAHDANCTISCHGAFSCENMAINVENVNTNYNSLQFNCQSDIDSDCNGMAVTVHVAEIKVISINCHGNCKEFVFAVDADVVGDIVIHCGCDDCDTPCEDSKWTANVENFERAKLVCNSTYSCVGSEIGFSDAKSMTLDCDYAVSALCNRFCSFPSFFN